MEAMDVRIVQLEPLRVVSFHGFGEHPEGLAHEKLADWAGPRGYLADRQHHRIFGFNNPNPGPGSPNYGYEFWMEVGPEEPEAGGPPVKEFPGGRYAVSRLEVKGAPEAIGNAWQALYRWVENHGYRMASHQWLEEEIASSSIDEGDFVLDLYLPIAE